MVASVQLPSLSVSTSPTPVLAFPSDPEVPDGRARPRPRAGHPDQDRLQGGVERTRAARPASRRCPTRSRPGERAAVAAVGGPVAADGHAVLWSSGTKPRTDRGGDRVGSALVLAWAGRGTGSKVAVPFLTDTATEWRPTMTCHSRPPPCRCRGAGRRRCPSATRWRRPGRGPLSARQAPPDNVSMTLGLVTGPLDSRRRRCTGPGRRRRTPRRSVGPRDRHHWRPGIARPFVRPSRRRSDP